MVMVSSTKFSKPIERLLKLGMFWHTLALWNGKKIYFVLTFPTVRV